MRLRISVIVGTLILGTQISLAIDQSKRVSIDSLRTMCSQLFLLERSEYQGQVGFSTSIVEPESSGVLSGLVDDHELLLGYLLDHSQEVFGPGNNSLLQIEDGNEMNRAFQTALESDSSFNQWMLPLLSRWLRIQGQDIDESFVTKADTSAWTWNEVFPLAARFIYIDGLNGEGQFQAHFCAGINGIDTYEGRKNLWVEAFALEAIMEDLFSDEPGMYEEYQRLGPLAKHSVTESDSAKVVLQAQKAMFDLMTESEVLQRLLRSKYSGVEGILPIRIVESEQHSASQTSD